MKKKKKQFSIHGVLEFMRGCELSQAVLHLLSIKEWKGCTSNAVMEFAFAIRLQRYSKAGTVNEFRQEKKMQPLVFV